MGLIHVTDRDGTVHKLAGRERASLMEILKYGGLDIAALCSGSCQCATCHVLVGSEWLAQLPPQSERELLTLESEVEDILPTSRLACQIRWDESLDGLRLALAPES